MWDFLFTHTPLLYFTQSLWRDEVFSVLYSQHSIPFILTKSSMEPPFYYLLLHFWMKLFGTSEIAVRSLSLLGFTLATIVVIEWAHKLFKHHFLAWALPLLFFINPMLLYYAFETRTYGWYVFFAVLGMWAYKEKKWTIYTITAILGIYTHLYYLFLLFAQGIHFGITQKQKINLSHIRSLVQEPFIKSLIIIFICFIPWIYRLFFEITKMTHSWYYPVDFQLIKSVLGNLYTGYEGNPVFLWPYTAGFSFLLFISFLYAVWHKKTQKDAFYFFLIIFIPLITIIGISFFKPLFVNRYVIPVTIAEIFLLGYAISTLPSRLLQKGVALCFIVGSIAFTLWYAPYHTKKDFRKTLQEINAIRKPDEPIYASDAIIFLETLYYADSQAPIKLYNPYNKPFPWYIGDAVFSPLYFTSSLPVYPNRAFIVQKDASYILGSQTTSMPPY